jgi:hypothetical protein
MPILQIGVPFESVEPNLLVEVNRQQPLTTGAHRFILQVVDDSGNISDPAELTVLVVDATRPNAVIDGPRQVNFLTQFELSGKASFDIGGKIVKYIWTLMG